MSLTVGDKAPDFILPSSEGGTVSLQDFQGSPLVVYFYPKDDTPGCTKEACNFRDSIDELKKAGAAVIGISKDDLASHAKFKDKYKLNFPLASDQDGKTIEAYGAWMEKSMFGKKYMGIGRCTFLIDGDGRVVNAWRDVKVNGHIDEVLAAISALKKKAA
jgi:thioredoxin-dependent peroxiredoxin